MRKLVASVTELEAFQGCPRRWRLSREWGPRLVDPKLWLGDGVHKALEGYYRAKKATPEMDAFFWGADMFAAYDKWAVSSKAELCKVYGNFWHDIEAAYSEIIVLGRQMLEHYLLYEMDAETQLLPVLIERRMFVPVRDANGKRTANVVSAKIDLVAKTPDGDVLVVDNKTAATRSNSGRSLDINEQGTGYVWGIWRATGKVYDFAHNTLIKTIPQPPREVGGRAKRLSVDKSQHTTFHLYMEAINKRGEHPDMYMDILAHLNELGWSKYFKREISPRNEHQVVSYEARANVLMGLMRKALDDDAYAYPAPSPLRCPTCPFLSVCLAKEEGSDYEYLLNANFVRTTEDVWATPARLLEAQEESESTN